MAKDSRHNQCGLGCTPVLRFDHGLDHGIMPRFMEEIAISKFKATCLAVLERVRKTGKPILVTRFGEPVAEVIPPKIKADRSRWIGAFKDSGEIVGDIISPATDESDWEVLRS